MELVELGLEGGVGGWKLHTQGPRIYLETGDLSTLEYLYDLR